MRLAVILSSGGSALQTAISIVEADLDMDLTIITNSTQAARQISARHRVSRIDIEENTTDKFEERCLDVFKSCEIKECLLMFNRIVSQKMFDFLPIYNVHPAILPAFPGLDGVLQAHLYRSRLLGCSLHRVDATLDNGPLIAQIARSVDPEWPIERWRKLAYLMKVYCILVWLSHAADRKSLAPSPINASHSIPNSWQDGFDKFQSMEGERVV